MLCVWCVNGENKQPAVDGNQVQSKNDTNSDSDEIQMESDGIENSRQPRQLNPGGFIVFQKYHIVFYNSTIFFTMNKYKYSPCNRLKQNKTIQNNHNSDKRA